MANTKISQLSNIGNTTGDGVFVPVVDTLDTTQSASGTTKKADLESVVNASGYEFTGGFAAKTDQGGGVYGYAGNAGVQYTSANAAAGNYERFGLDGTVQVATDAPYWTIPTPNTAVTGFGLFAGDHLPAGKDTTLIDFTSTPWAGSTMSGNDVADAGSIALDGLKVGDYVQVRFDYNIIPQVQNTVVDTGLWWANRNASNVITGEFFLQGGTTFFGQGTVGVSRLQRVTMSGFIASQEDINAIALPAIKADNQVIIQPLTMLVSITK
tara:strand:+ start:11323 stop:12126 length:804 start_codon:yes stop_codon:yes gene_type:complete